LSRRDASACDARATIAGRWLGVQGFDTLGTIVLRPHQSAAVGRLHALLGEARGALLADPVGLGKTYTALAVARSATQLVIVAPAALRAMWNDALAATQLQARFVSHHALSRGAPCPCTDFLIVDEAHHARNPATRRYAALAGLCARAPVLLLSATPIHNRIDDLRAELALFLGERAWSAPEAELTRFVVKREIAEDGTDDGTIDLPRVGGVRWVDVGDDLVQLDAVAGLPPPLPPRDGGDGGALLAISLARQWASSRAALRAALRRRLAQGEALSEALRAGRHPSRHELRAWSYADGVLQLAFPQLMADRVTPDGPRLIDASERHTAAVARLLRDLDTAPDPDDVRAMALCRIQAAHPDTRIVVFAEFAATVSALYARLRSCGGIAMLTDRGGFVAGGRITRHDLLAQFAPGRQVATTATERVSMLITTDLLSEGVNLQDASVVVHADLPWSPARFEQRVGRVRRLASPHTEVHVYALRPPAPADRLLHLERRLRHKLAAAARAVGVRGTIMPALFSGAPIDTPSPLRARADLSLLLADWLRAGCGLTDSICAAGVLAGQAGWLALIDRHDRTDLLADLGQGPTDSPDVVLDAARLAGGVDAPLDPTVVHAALRSIEAWIEEGETFGVFDLATGGAARARRRLLRRIDAIAARSPRHLRSRYVPLAIGARRAATSTFGAGAERVLEELADAPMDDEAWLSAVRTFADLHARDSRPASPVSVRALLVLVPSSRPSAAEADPR
jgi:superfamily II DNA or RNA helicase